MIKYQGSRHSFNISVGEKVSVHVFGLKDIPNGLLTGYIFDAVIKRLDGSMILISFPEAGETGWWIPNPWIEGYLEICSTSEQEEPIVNNISTSIPDWQKHRDIMYGRQIKLEEKSLLPERAFKFL